MAESAPIASPMSVRANMSTATPGVTADRIAPIA